MRDRPLMFPLAMAGAAVFATASLANPASPAPPQDRQRSCFFITQWEGWKAPSDTVIYLGVNNRDVYRVDLSVGSPQLRVPGYFLISRNRGSSSICSAIDLDLTLADHNGAGPGRVGMQQPLIARNLTKLTPEEVAAIPRKYRPY